jgi:hypothetical protein
MADYTILIFIVLIILAILSIIFSPGILGDLLAKAKKRKLNYLKENGEIIEAEITDFKYWTVRHTTILHIVARMFMYGAAQEFISERIYRVECNLKEGDKVRILVNMKNPKQYYFDPYQKKY